MSVAIGQADALARALDRAQKRVNELEAALKPFARCPTIGKHGGRFVIAKALYDDGDVSPRGAHWHMSDFDKARAALPTMLKGNGDG